MANDPAGSAPGLVAGFFAKARPVYLGEAKYEVLDASDIVKIAADPQACAEFMRRFAKDTQDHDFQQLILNYLQNIADNLGQGGGEADQKAYREVRVTR
jgi:hypothetical protein